MTGPEVRCWVRGFDDRATFGHRSTIQKLAKAVIAIQKQDRLQRLAEHKVFYNGLPFLGVQWDHWTDTATHTSYGAVTVSMVTDPKGDEGNRLVLVSELIAFNVFPESKNGDTIAAWVQKVLRENNIAIENVTGVNIDGESAGHLAVKNIEGLGEKTDTCVLHQLQRAILTAAGLAKKPCRNPGFQTHLRKHTRIAKLANQSLSFSQSMKDEQMKANVPDHKVLKCKTTCITRWSNIYDQVSRDNVASPVITVALKTYKSKNKGNQEAIVEEDPSEGASKVGRAVAAADIGLTDKDWELSIQVEALLGDVAVKVAAIEHRFCHYGTAMVLVADLYLNGCAAQAPLEVQLLPATAAVADRVRPTETISAKDLDPVITLARKVLKEELHERFFVERPSNAAMVLMYMTKQGPQASDYLTPAQTELAKTLYLSWLRSAHDKIVAKSPSHAERSSPRKPAKRSKLFSSFRQDHDEEATAEEDVADAVTSEVASWAAILPNGHEVSSFRDEDGLLDEYAMFWAWRKRFPLHFIVFKQTASHLPYEANVERVFSLAGYLSDPCRHADHLVDMVMASVNRKACDPSVDAITTMYYEMFRGIAEAGTVNSELDSD